MYPTIMPFPMRHWTAGKPLKNGQYIIEGILGFGGFGVTYRARHSKTEQPLAIKTLNYKRQRQENFDELQEKFLNEALCLAKCSHPHIVQVYNVFLEENLWCMAMEYVPGEGLDDYLVNRGKLSQSEALRIIREIGEALTCVHNQGFLHRDIKPANILLRQPNLASVLIDFGIAREFLPGVTQTHTNYSTENYAPIEQFERRAQRGNSTDIYALAVTLYELLTGKLPVPAKWRKAANIPVEAPQTANPDIDGRVSEAIVWGLEIEPENRPQSVEEWFDLLFPAQPAVINPISIPPIIEEPDLILQTFDFKVITIDNRGRQIDSRNHQAQYFSEPLGNGILLEMVRIPAGTFLMGSPQTELERFDNEGPQHQVRVPEFFMGKYPVTQAQWQAVMGNN
ncbi:bifunctional serine/threonine-protein kinase/formylglycine-generating enzyme family protein, partial [Phormidium sp. CCY1219]|uniref:bifunctional serine/threonine-protein kinase/formylglycine-generating enzyme family protein n=1 Tax=Phormidium sp. CCY1219 TaxID=2886104 RepID=UPI002D1EB7E6